MRTDSRHNSSTARSESRRELSETSFGTNRPFEPLHSSQSTSEATIGIGLGSSPYTFPEIDRRHPLSLDTELVQQTKDRIRGIVHEITQASQTSASPRDFFRFAMQRICQAMGAEASGIWTWSESQSWRLAIDESLPTSLHSDSGGHATQAENATEFSQVVPNPSEQSLERLETQLHESLSREKPRVSLEVACPPKRPSSLHAKLLDAVRREGQPILVPPRETLISKSRPQNPLQELLILVPISLPSAGEELWLQIVQSPSGGPASQRGYLRFAAQMADLLSDFLRNYQVHQLEQERQLLNSSLELMKRNFKNTKQLSQAAATKVRDLSHADHVVMFHRRKRRKNWTVVAIAGIEKLDPHSQAIQATENAANELLAPPRHNLHLRHFQSDGASEDRSQAMSQSHSSQDVEQETTTSAHPVVMEWARALHVRRSMWFYPLEAPCDLTQKHTSAVASILGETSTESIEGRSPENATVALMIGWSDETLPPERCGEHASHIIQLAARMQTSNSPSLLVPRTREAFTPQRTKSVLAFAVLCTIILSILAIPVPIQIESTATLVPKVAKEIFSSQEGTIDSVRIKHGQTVKAGETCIALDSPKLRAEYDLAVANHVKTNQRASDIQNRLLRDRELTAPERDSLESEQQALIQILALEQSTIDLLARRLHELEIKAPMDGVVETWNVDELLLDRPVRTGQWLFSIRSANDGWELEGNVPERKFKELVEIPSTHFSGHARMVSAPQIAIPLSWDRKQSLRVSQAQESSSLGRGKTDAQLKVRFGLVDVIPTELATSGASARIAIETGRGPLAWALTKDFFEDVAMRIRMWLP